MKKSAKKTGTRHVAIGVKNELKMLKFVRKGFLGKLLKYEFFGGFEKTKRELLIKK